MRKINRTWHPIIIPSSTAILLYVAARFNIGTAFIAIYFLTFLLGLILMFITSMRNTWLRDWKWLGIHVIAFAICIFLVYGAPSPIESKVRSKCVNLIEQYCKSEKSDFESLVKCLGQAPAIGKVTECDAIRFSVIPMPQLKSSRQVGNLLFPKGTMIVRDAGQITAVNVPENWLAHGVHCKKGSSIIGHVNELRERSDDDTYLSSCTLNGDQIFDGIKLKGETSPSFFPNGKIQAGILAEDLTIQNKLVKANSWIRFDKEGTLFINR